MKEIKIKESLDFFKRNVGNEFCAVSCSGGIDSTFLLNLLSDGANLMLIHVNHNVSTNSIHWEKKCISDANSLSIRYKILRINISKLLIKKHGFEEAARISRYSCISNYMKETKIKYLITGHNLDDFVETFFLNLLRGCGSLGLLSIRRKICMFGITIIRPILYISREYIINLTGKKYKFVNDESNNFFLYRRNIIRFVLNKYILPFYKNYRSVILRDCKILSDLFKINSSLALIDLKNTNLYLFKINKLPEIRIRNLLIHKIIHEGVKNNSERWLKEVIRQLKSYKKNMYIKSKNVRIVIKKGKLFFIY
ncbi:tRNA lysidine(34) synthetase TilS [Candidatus Vidania fulgoroideorum]